MNESTLPGIPDPAPAKRGRKARAAPAAAVRSSRGAGGGASFVRATVIAMLVMFFWLPMISLGMLLMVTMVSGCEFVYLPECDTDCTAAGGADAYGRSQ